jgi:cytochrome P450 PksS
MVASMLRSLPTTDLSDPVMFENPFPRYAELRREAPVSRVLHQETRKVEAFMLTRYEDVLTLHSDARFSSDPFRGRRGAVVRRMLPRMFRLLVDSMVFKDDPEHKRLRGLVNKAFTPKMVQRMAGDVQAIADQLLDGLAKQAATTGTVDLVRDLAVPLPLAVIAEMLGVDARDREDFHDAVERMTQDASGGNVVAVLRMVPTGRRMVKLFDRLAAQRRVEPDDRLITALVRANDDGDVLSEHEIIAMIFLLLLAGHDTTSNLIGSSVLTLIEHPDELHRLRRDPAMIDTAVEELLRYTTPVPCGATRTLLDDVEIAGTTLPKGASVLGMIISANRDDAVFDDPDRLDLSRQPNRHLSFAFGSHFCLGNQLARMEARIALSGLLERFDRIELAVPRSSLQWKPTQSLRGLRSLPLRLS